MNWVMTDSWSDLVIDQAVVSAFINGDTSDFFELSHGPISFALGAEYRTESSDATFDPWQRGVIPPGSPTAAGGQLIDISGNDSLTLDRSYRLRMKEVATMSAMCSSRRHFRYLETFPLPVS